jgi:hypothetical protein
MRRGEAIAKFTPIGERAMRSRSESDPGMERTPARISAISEIWRSSGISYSKLGRWQKSRRFPEHMANAVG